MTKKSIAKLCILTSSILGLSASAWAADKEVADPKKNVVEQTKESCITGDIGINVVSQYISRGVVYENQGGIIQPYADLYFAFYKGDGALTKASVNLGVWESFHSRHTQAGLSRGVSRDSQTTAQWYESDFTAGIALTFFKNLTITPSYYTFLSPNSASETFQGLNINVTYDDTDLLKGFALHPHFTTLVELDHKAGSGTREGVYYEVGVAPAAPVGPVTFTLPLTVGFGSDGFYEHNQGFGYFSGGINAAYAMKFIPACLGTWTVQGGVTYYYLGHGLRDYNTGSEFAIRDARNNEVVYSGGLSVAF